MEQQIYKAPEGSKIVSVTTEENRVVIEFEKIEEVFVPKDGDICVAYYGRLSPYIFIAKPMHGKIYNYALLRYTELRIGSTSSYSPDYNFRLATPAESQQLFDALAADGKRWNADLKRIEKVRERAKHGGVYYTALSDSGRYVAESSSDDYLYADNKRYERGNYFLNESDCQRLCDLLNETVKNFE